MGARYVRKSSQRLRETLKNNFSEHSSFFLKFSWLIDSNGFSILPCNEFSIKAVKVRYASSSLLLLNPIPQTTPALSIMDSLFHRLWLVFLQCLVNISACCLSSLHSPLCCIDLFVHPLHTTFVVGRRSITEFNTFHRARFILFFPFYFFKK